MRNDKAMFLLTILTLQVQYWPEQQKKQVYGSLSVCSKTEETVNDALCTRAFEVYRNGSVTAVSETKPVYTTCLCEECVSL